MSQLVWYMLQVTMPSSAPGMLAYAQYKDELFVGPHVRLTGIDKGAHLEDRELAGRYADAVLPILERRYGDGCAVEVLEVQESGRSGLKEQILRHSEIVKSRLLTGNFAPNKRPELPAER